MNLFVPYIAPSTNAMYSGQHWIKRKTHKAIALKAVVCALAISRNNTTRFDGPVEISIQPHLGKGKRAYDVSNYSYTYKLIEDCLVERGILKNDTSGCVAAVKFLSPVR